MKKNKISIQIDVSIKKLFRYTSNPENTSFWIDSIEKEWVDWDKKIGIWIIYKSKRKDWKIYSYKLIDYKEEQVFHLKSLDSDIEVIYEYTKINNKKSELDYYINSSDLELIEFVQNALKKLKIILEKN